MSMTTFNQNTEHQKGFKFSQKCYKSQVREFFRTKHNKSNRYSDCLRSIQLNPRWIKKINHRIIKEVRGKNN